MGMPTSPPPAESREALLELLNEASSPYRDPAARLPWEHLDTDSWWLPPRALSLSGVPAFEALPQAQKLRLSHYEFVHLLETGLWLESLFIHRLGRALDTTREVALRTRYLHEIREEAGHSLMFLELIERSGVRLPDPHRERPWLADRIGRLVPESHALFWPLVVIGEELPDKLNRTVRPGADDVILSSVVYHMATVHAIDEARHIAHARASCEAQAARVGALRKRLLGPVLSLAVDRFTTYLFYPSARLYAAAGLPASANWAVLARRNEARRRFVAYAVKPTLNFLRGLGWAVHSRHEDAPLA